MGYDINKQMSGLICFKHFRPGDVRTSKNNKIYQLVCGAIPIVDSIEKEKIEEMPEIPERSENVIPIVDSIENKKIEEMPERSKSFEKVNENQPSSSSPAQDPHDQHDMVGMVGMVDSEDSNGQTCDQRSLKESCIKMYECKIENLQKRLKKAENSANYLKSANLKLNETLLQQKQENSANMELIKELEVGFICNFF